MGYNFEDFRFKKGVTCKDILKIFNDKLCENDFRGVTLPSTGLWRNAREAFIAWGFSFDSETFDISFYKQSIGDEDRMWSELAPLVEKGSVINYFGECMFVFDGERMEIKRR